MIAVADGGMGGHANGDVANDDEVTASEHCLMSAMRLELAVLTTAPSLTRRPASGWLDPRRGVYSGDGGRSVTIGFAAGDSAYRRPATLSSSALPTITLSARSWPAPRERRGPALYPAEPPDLRARRPPRTSTSTSSTKTPSPATCTCSARRSLDEGLRGRDPRDARGGAVARPRAALVAPRQPPRRGDNITVAIACSSSVRPA